MATPAQDFRKMFESMPQPEMTLAQSFRKVFAEEQAKDETALYISPRLLSE